MTSVDALSGVVEGMDEAEYHAHPALSSSGARKLLPPSCPALFRHEQQYGQPPRDAFDLGHAVHAKVLGVGSEIFVVDAADWRSKGAQQQRDEARAAGHVPLLRADADRVQRMTDAVLTHPLAGPLFRQGRPELSLFWDDWAFGVQRRARLDWLILEDGVAHIVDLKTTTSAEPSSFAKSVATFGYDLQACWYTDAVRALGLADEVRFTFVAVEKTAPHVVGAFELTDDWLRIGQAKADQAIAVYAECSSRDEWPAYAPGVTFLRPPRWLAREYEDVLSP